MPCDSTRIRNQRTCTQPHSSSTIQYNTITNAFPCTWPHNLQCNVSCALSFDTIIWYMHSSLRCDYGFGMWIQFVFEGTATATAAATPSQWRTHIKTRFYYMFRLVSDAAYVYKLILSQTCHIRRCSRNRIQVQSIIWWQRRNFANNYLTIRWNSDFPKESKCFSLNLDENQHFYHSMRCWLRKFRSIQILRSFKSFRIFFPHFPVPLKASSCFILIQLYAYHKLF